MPIEKQQAAAEANSNRQSAIGNPQFIEVSAALIFRGGKLLITQRHAKAHLGGCWEFPGGKREAGESFEQLARAVFQKPKAAVSKKQPKKKATRHRTNRSDNG